jgi:hypothetical protein
MRRRDIWVTSSRSSDLGAPSFLMARILAATFSMETRVSARRPCEERGLVTEAVGCLDGSSTSMASAASAVAMSLAGAERDDGDDARGRSTVE